VGSRAWLGLVALLGLSPQSPAQIVDRAEAQFEEGHLAESVAEYDRLAALVPSVAPELWQRGIALYYLGRYSECAQQFASFYSINPADMENAAWHFFCVARGQSLAAAREHLLAVKPDRRVMRQQVYDLLAGKVTPADFIAEADTSVPIARFYGHLYLALYLEAAEDAAGSLAEIRRAAADEYREYGGFMNTVAQLHLKLRSTK